MSPKLLRGYLYFVMGGLFLQGIGSLLFRINDSWPAHSPLLIRGIFGIDFWHSWIHIAWGAVGVAFLRHAPDDARRDPTCSHFWRLLYAAGHLGHVDAPPTRACARRRLRKHVHLTAGPLGTLALGLLARQQGAAPTRPLRPKRRLRLSVNDRTPALDFIRGQLALGNDLADVMLPDAEDRPGQIAWSRCMGRHRDTPCRHQFR